MHQNTTTTSKKVFFPNLDGLRFIAFLAVFLFHSGHTDYDYIKESPTYDFIKRGIFSYGRLGVNFFFVLSGFLITYLLLDEEFKTNKIRIGHFYLRRLLRIWPLYFFCLLFGFTLFPLLKTALGQTPIETADPLLFITFLSNFNNIKNGLPDASILGVLWSVSIEEQFYIFWPLLFILFRQNRPALFLLIIASTLLFRQLNRNNPDVLYFHTFSLMADMAMGGLLGWLAYNKKKFIRFFENQSIFQILLLYILGFTLIIVGENYETLAWFKVIKSVLYSFFFGFIILEQNFAKKSFYKTGKNKFITYWGKYTYGLYCLHFIGILITTNLSKLLNTNKSILQVLGFETIMALILSLIISWISFNYFEKYFLLLKEKYGYKNIKTNNLKEVVS